MSHANAQLAPSGRLRLARLVVDQGWPLRRAAERWNCSVTTAKRWADRYRAYGHDGMHDLSSRPHRPAGQTSRRRERRVVGLRVSRRWGPARIAFLLGMPVSTVHKILTRYGCPPLSWTDPATGVRIRGPHGSRREIRRYQWDLPGQMVHVDIKKLGRIPDGGGWRYLGRRQGGKNRSATTARTGGPKSKHRQPLIGTCYLHTVIDDHSRVAYVEAHDDEKKETAAGVLRRAVAWFKARGITVERVLSDNGPAYRSHHWRDVCVELGIKHKRTRPYRPQTNGKIERFHRTLAEGWAFKKFYSSETARLAALPGWLHEYNHHRSHSAIGKVPPITRLTNLAGHHS